jgi:hypothetical protein
MLGITFRKGFHDLLTRPFCRRRFRDAEVKNSPPPMLDHEEHEQDAQSNRRNGEEINRDDLAQVIPGTSNGHVH